MSEDEGTDKREWNCGWDEHKRRQLQRLAKLPLAEKLEWLEEAQQLGDRLIEQGSKGQS